ncbi:hypothetical protein MFRU_040g00590 [Monilinia fructicola]|nr:hypothetical protein MFRU_040g00590 [Monilinia fructicola]
MISTKMMHSALMINVSTAKQCNGFSSGTHRASQIKDRTTVLANPHLKIFRLCDLIQISVSQRILYKIAPADITPDAISRFRAETLRIYDVLELRLSGRYTGMPREFLAGTGKGKYSIADGGTWPWVRSWRYAKFTDEEMRHFPHLLQWIARIAARPAVQRGISEFCDSEENPELRGSTKT